MQTIIQFMVRHPILSMLWITLLTAVLLTMLKNLTAKVILITSSEATSLINKENAIIVDLRKLEEFSKGHIVGALNIVPKNFKTNNLDVLEKHKDKPIIVVDYTGMQQARNFAKVLTKAEFKKVFVLKEGIFGWNCENLPLVRSK